MSPPIRVGWGVAEQDGHTLRPLCLRVEAGGWKGGRRQQALGEGRSLTCLSLAPPPLPHAHLQSLLLSLSELDVCPPPPIIAFGGCVLIKAALSRGPPPALLWPLFSSGGGRSCGHSRGEGRVPPFLTLNRIIRPSHLRMSWPGPPGFWERPFCAQRMPVWLRAAAAGQGTLRPSLRSSGALGPVPPH